MQTGTSLLVGSGHEKKSLKELVVEALSEEWPLSVKVIYFKLRKMGSTVTYQGVHKALSLLLTEGIVRKSDGGYCLSSEWVLSLQRFSSELSARYSGELAGAAGQSTFVLDSIYGCDLFLFDFFGKIYSEKDRLLTMSWSHFWMPFFFSNKEYAKSKELVKLFDGYSVTPGNTIVDKWCHSYWTKNYLKTAVGVDLGYLGDLVAYRDYVAQVFYPKKTRDAIDRLYAKVNRASEFDVDEFFEFAFDKNVKVPVVITRSPELARQVKQEIVSVFTKSKT